MQRAEQRRRAGCIHISRRCTTSYSLFAQLVLTAYLNSAARNCRSQRGWHRQRASASEQFHPKFCRIISTRCLKRLFELSPPTFPGEKPRRNCWLWLQQILCSCVYVKCGTRGVWDRLGKKQVVLCTCHLAGSVCKDAVFLVRCLWLRQVRRSSHKTCRKAKKSTQQSKIHLSRCLSISHEVVLRVCFKCTMSAVKRVHAGTQGESAGEFAKSFWRLCTLPLLGNKCYESRC